MKKIHFKQMMYILPISTLLLTSGCDAIAKQTFSQDAVVSVNVSKAQKEFIATGAIYTGVIKPSEEITIIPKMAGKVVELPVAVGTSVKKGQVLLKLDDKELNNAVKQASAAESAAKANVESVAMGQESGVVKAESGVVQAKGSVEQANSGIIQAEANVTKTKNAINEAENAIKDSELAVANAQQVLNDTTTNYNRMKQLYAESLISKAELEKSELALNTAQTKYDSAKITHNDKITSLDTAKKAYEAANKAYGNASQSYQTASEGYNKAQEQVDVSQNTSSITASEEAWKQAQVGVQVAQDRLADSVITAPIDGVIGVKNTDIGEMVSTQSPALVVVAIDRVNVLAYIPATEINNIQQGSQVQVKTVSFDSVTMGTVKTISPLDAQGKGYPVEIEIPNPDHVLKSGLIVDLQFVEDDADEGMVIPSSAVSKKDGKSYVYVAKDDHPKRKEVNIAEKKGSMVVVTKGITENDLVITNNVSILSSDVKITYEQPKAKAKAQAKDQASDQANDQANEKTAEVKTEEKDK